ncbi:MAG: uracil-DNA glycosylase [Gammaproteobacteria bacterium]|nr:MAG: uracil-DNA glycosylase [Gammaproteobacteria bacterium]
MLFDPDCAKCERLSAFLNDVRADHPDYFCAPVPPFGDPDAQLLIVGLAPGMHGANRSGRPFTGDHAGILLYRTIFEAGFSSQPVSIASDDELRLTDCRISNAVKCLPPANKPTTQEIRNCNPYLASEISSLDKNAVVLALGKIAHDSVLRALGIKLSRHQFAHAAVHNIPGPLYLVDSYHCSRYNTQTRRLTEPMFQAVFQKINQLLDKS